MQSFLWIYIDENHTFPSRKAKIIRSALKRVLLNLIDKCNLTKSYQYRAALEELTQLLGQSRKLLTTLSLRQIPPKTLAKFTVDLANTIVEAHDTVGWGTATNIRRVLQVGVVSNYFLTINTRLLRCKIL